MIFGHYDGIAGAAQKEVVVGRFLVAAA